MTACSADDAVWFEVDGDRVKISQTKPPEKTQDLGHDPDVALSLTGTLADMALKQVLDERPVGVVLQLVQHSANGRSAA